jgi:hypothetical protein
MGDPGIWKQEPSFQENFPTLAPRGQFRPRRGAAVSAGRPELLGDPNGFHVRFDYGFGTNVHICLNEYHQLAMSIQGWEKLCSLVDEYRGTEESEAVSERCCDHPVGLHRNGRCFGFECSAPCAAPDQPNV